MNTLQPSFYAIIPANVRYHPDLEPNAKLLYGEITALCNSQGFCWATNQYFADLYKVEDRTIRRWISALSEAKFIFVEIDQKGFQTQRRIFISKEIQKMFAGGQKCPGGGTKMSANNNTKNNTPVVVVREKNLDVVVEDVHKIADEEKKRAALASFDLSKKDLDEILPMPIERIETAILAVNQYSETKDVDNINGLLKTAIKEEWKPKKKIKAKAPIKKQEQKKKDNITPDNTKKIINDPLPPGEWRLYYSNPFGGIDTDQYEEDEIHTRNNGTRLVRKDILSKKQQKLQDDKEKKCT